MGAGTFIQQFSEWERGSSCPVLWGYNFRKTQCTVGWYRRKKSSTDALGYSNVVTDLAECLWIADLKKQYTFSTACGHSYVLMCGTPKVATNNNNKSEVGKQTFFKVRKSQICQFLGSSANFWGVQVLKSQIRKSLIHQF